jgi:hypothetical protein
MLSRLTFPTNCIDIFFENSSWSLETKKICGWYSFKSVIVGNPKYDDLYLTPISNDGILIFGTKEKEANIRVYQLLEQLDTYSEKVYYRPHPGEVINTFPYKNIELITDVSTLPYIAANTRMHIGNISISAYYSVVFNKQFLSIDEFIKRSDDLNIDFFKGAEYNFWAPIIKVNTWNEFVNKIDLNRIRMLQERYITLKHNFIPYHDITNLLKNDIKLLDYKLFDEFSDNHASKRIVDYIKKI